MASFADGIIIRASTNFRNLCSGYGSPAQLLLNGTVFIICNPLVSSGMTEDDKLALGLGLGLGIPAFAILSVCIMRWCTYYNDRRIDATLPPRPDFTVRAANDV
jgi:hypothetical protein